MKDCNVGESNEFGSICKSLFFLEEKVEVVQCRHDGLWLVRRCSARKGLMALHVMAFHLCNLPPFSSFPIYLSLPRRILRALID
ncbi:hypothetical protein EUGRSUZ_A02075 [Eucalyptus grandis]|uniref:Uncharacterized protein n=2 Tax=Eucalyptus grandis TaxID=71139 RepID=A0ACC3M6E9_EUCGR|nr:hypothetical protein EUGRSUZ_A02075 [Eucalyptus grandis]